MIIHTHQLAWLQRLAGNRPVYAYAFEIGARCPVLRGASLCAPFFAPWRAAEPVTYVKGRVMIRVPLADLVAGGHGRQLLVALKRHKPARLAGLGWPHSALRHLAAGNREEARQALRVHPARSPIALQDCIAAATYWAWYLEDVDMARQCLRNADAAGADPWEEHNLSRLAECWCELCRDADSALTLLQQAMQIASDSDCGRGDNLLRAAEACVKLQKPDWAEKCLRQAMQAKRIARYRLGMACLGLLNQRRASALCARLAAGQGRATLLSGVMFWQVSRGDERRAHDLYERVGLKGLDLPGLRELARAAMLHFEDQGTAARALRKAAQGASTVADLCRVGRDFELLLGDTQQAERLLGLAIQHAKDAGQFLNVAASYLDALGYEGVCRDMLALAESASSSHADWLHCALYWLHLLGDPERVIHCLREAEQRATGPRNFLEIAALWTDGLGNGQEGKRVLAKGT